MFGQKKAGTEDDFKRAAAKGMSYGITQGLEALIEEFGLDEKKAQMTFIRAFEKALAESVGEDPGFFAGRNPDVKELFEQMQD